ncbi:hypothetical protein GCM10023335_66440 [Streptomyces siamensis]|uniref:Uncharacterized protein n=1 Tax=Streptomyces siamensis TaxID=1274986 RepID=A0ABP9JFN2_9ACTN
MFRDQHWRRSLKSLPQDASAADPGTAAAAAGAVASSIPESAMEQNERRMGNPPWPERRTPVALKGTRPYWGQPVCVRKGFGPHDGFHFYNLNT